MVNMGSQPGSEVVLVTGGSGFLGMHIVKLLQENDPKVREIRILDLKPYVNLLDHEEKKPMWSVVGDVAELSNKVREVFHGVDCVIHCAALVSYAFPADEDALERNNVTGTQNVVSMCLELGVPRLVFCSTSEVTLTPYLGGIWALIINQTESKAVPPASMNRLLVPGYPASKLRAERIVLQADGTPLSTGEGTLRTVALRPTLLYGEQDPRLVPSMVRLAESMDGLLFRFAGSGGRHQLTYAGNAAWAHLRAKDALSATPESNSGVAGLPIFITDDTPVNDLLRFAQKVTFRDADQPPRCRLSRWYVPAVLAYLLALLIEIFVLVTRLPHHLPVPPRGIVAYLGSVVLYNRLRAALHLNYTPLFQPQETMARSNKFYLREKL